MSREYFVVNVGYFQLDDCHGDLYASGRVTDEGNRSDFPPDGFAPDGMGFYDVATGSGFVLDQTKLLATVPSKAFVIGADNAFGGFDAFADIVYQDGTRTFYAAVTNSPPPADLIAYPDHVSPYTVDTVRQSYYLPAVAASSPARSDSINAAVIFAQTGAASHKPVATRLQPGFFGRASSYVTTNTVQVSDAFLQLGAFIGPVLSRPTPVDYPAWTFHELYHPYVCRLVGDVYKGGPEAVYTRDVEVAQSSDYFAARYAPTAQIAKPYPLDDYDFTQTGGYAIYNWEMFFHVPLLIATRLMTNQRFEDAQKWFHYIFNPTDASSAPAPQRYWVTKPFFEHTAADYKNQEIDRLMKLIGANSSDPELTAQIAQWQATPFDPHLIARLRTVAYQKSTVMKYLDNLIAWGDQLFGQNTIETINQATQLYVLAAEILGRRPEMIAPRATVAPETYDSLEPQLDAFSNAHVAAENLVPPMQSGHVTTSTSSAVLPPMLYFAIPINAKLLGYWDTVADRLFKIRHSLNIEGIFQQLPLFEPPIDPALLVAATAAGVDISSALSDLNAPAPLYRFSVVLEKAHAFCAEVKSLGTALLAALEKSDAEGMALLRSSNELALLNAVKNVKAQQVQEAADVIDGLTKSKAVVQLRRDYYAGQQLMLDGEKTHLDALTSLATFEGTQSLAAAGMAAVYIIPEIKAGFPSTDGASFGGSNAGNAAAAGKEALAHHSAETTASGQSAVTMATYARRFADHQFQARVSAAEMVQIQSQIHAATLRQQIAQAELDNTNLQIENAQAADDLMHSKFTNQELYDWMINQASAVYFQAYHLAYDIAKRAEAGYRFELGVTDANYFVKFGYWNNLRQGLLAGDRLAYDLKQLEASYLEHNRRQYEITKYVSLAALSPQLLAKLRETGSCLIDIPEWVFDLDYPGHYMRRLKSISLTIPCVVGPYTSVNATLTLAANSVRLNTTGSYKRNDKGDDTRFKDNFASVQSIVTSTAQNDGGMFELNFRDERYLPFEGAGAISTWSLEMPPECNAFDFETISDVIMKLSYTAREGGADFKRTVQTAVALPPAANLARLTSAVHDFPNDWYRFQHPLDVAATTFTLKVTLGPERFPFSYRKRISAVPGLALMLRLGQPAGGQSPPDVVGQTFGVRSPDNKTATLSLVADPSGTTYGLPFADTDAAFSSANPFGDWTFTTTIDPTTIDDVFILWRYSVT